MVDRDICPTQCSRSCSCSYTSLIYSELLTDEEIPPTSDTKPMCSDSKGHHSPKCSCPPPSRPKAISMTPDVRHLPLSTAPCLPLPLSPTPISYYRAPDFHHMERNFFSAFDGKPFIPMEPQRVCYMTRSPRNFGEIFTAQYDRVWHLAKYELQRAEFLKPTDPNQTPFQSVIYLKGDCKGEGVPVMKEVAQVVNLKSVPEQLLGPQRSLSVKSQKDCSLLETIFNDCSSIYRAMGSSATSRSSQSQKATSSQSSQSGYGSDNSADELVRLWNEFFVKDDTKKKPGKESSSWEKSLSEEGAYRSNSDDYFPPGTKKYLTPNEAKFLEWEKEIGRLKEFLEDEEVKKIQKTTGGKKTKNKKRTTR